MQISYNDIILQIVKTRNFTRQAVYSSDNGDWICNRYMIDVTCVLNPDATSYDASGALVSGQFPVVTDTWIRHQLLEPGKQLLYVDEAANVSVSSPPDGNTVDVMYGPHPIECNVRQIAGSKTFIVGFQIETWLNDCPGQQASSPVASNRWTNTHIIDRNQITTINYHGETVLRSDALEDANQIADHFRGQCLPGCPRGFRRMGVQVQVNSIGNRMSWQVTDQQQLYFLGDGSDLKVNLDVLSFTGEYRQNTNSQSAGSAPSGILSQSFAMQVQGKPNANRLNLLLFAIKEAINRLALPAGPINPATDPMTTQIAVGEDLHQPVINFYVQTTLPCAIQAVQGFGCLQMGSFVTNGQNFQYGDTVFDPLGRTPVLGADNNTRTSSYTGLAFSAALQAACSTPPLTPLPVESASSSPNYPSSPAYNAYVTVSDSQPPITSPGYSQANAISGPYTEYRIDAVLDGDNHVVLLPTTGTVTGGVSSSEVVSVANRTNTVAFDWTAERQFNPPAAPSPFIDDNNYNLKTDSYQPASAAKLVDGFTNLYRMSGRYEYILSKPVASASAVNFPTTPIFNMIFGNVGQSDYQSGIIGSLTGSSSGSTGGGSSSSSSQAIGLDG